MINKTKRFKFKEFIKEEWSNLNKILGYGFLIISILILFYREAYLKQSFELFYRFIQFSFILAGFALTAGIFYSKNKRDKITKYLFNASYYFLVTGIFLIIFIAAFSFVQARYPQPDPNWLNSPYLELQNAYREINLSRITWFIFLSLFFILTIYLFVRGLYDIFMIVNKFKDIKKSTKD